MATKAKKKPTLSAAFTPGTFMQIEPCPARGKWFDSLFDDPDYFFEEKLDGDRRIGQIIAGEVRLTGRGVSVKEGPGYGLFVEKTANVPHITLSALVKSLKVTSDDSYDAETDINLLNRLRKLEGTILDGECLISQQQIDAIVAAGETTGGLSKFCTSIMGSLPGEAVQKQLERGFMRWVIFDCLAYKGKDLRAMPQMERRMYAAKAVEEWGNPYVSMAPMASQNKRAFLQEILARPFGEGIIAKHIAATYGDKKRWIKNKLLENHDCVIMGYEAPKKESEKTDGTVSVTKFHANGWIGAVVIGQYLDGKLTPMGTISGMDESIRIMLSGPKGKAHIGRVVEIECNGREPTLAFRHPRFNGFRDDKQATDCVYYAEET